jgi:hypothetical protein
MRTQEDINEELQEHLDARGVLIEAYLPNLSNDAIYLLARWSQKLEQTASALASWLAYQVKCEIERRDSFQPIDVKAIRLPVNWDNTDLADALVGIFAITQSNQSRELDALLSTLSLKIAVQAAERLKGGSNGH